LKIAPHQSNPASKVIEIKTKIYPVLVSDQRCIVSAVKATLINVDLSSIAGPASNTASEIV
jgi:hypothetical protein